jgi:hypothetical protein
MKKIIILIFVSFLTFTNSYSQLNITFGPFLGMTLPVNDYSGETTDYYAGTKYGLKSNVSFGLLTKLTFGPIKARASLTYSSLSNSGISEVSKPNSKTEIKNSLLIISIGPEYCFTIAGSPLKPCFGIDLLFSTISGSGSFQGTSNVSSDPYDIPSTSKTGLGLGFGVEFSFVKTTFDIGMRYNLVNLFGKSYSSTGNKREDAYKNINDAKDPLNATDPANHPVSADRSITTINLYLAILFGF